MSVGKDYKVAWEESYERGDNNILYPQAEVIRFLNRYVCKRNNDKTVTKLIKTLNDRTPIGLDFACGVGTHCITFSDFEVEGWGVDISYNAIQQAKRNASARGLSSDRFIELDAKEQKLPFPNDHFDFVVAESCLDSMLLDAAKKYINELKRVCSGVIYAGLIGSDNAMEFEEFEVQTAFEFGTYQTVFDEKKIASLFGSNVSNFIYFHAVTYTDIESKKITGKRFYCVIDSENLNSEN
ncbi:MAG: class I SAM-dependent methyltransferase [Methylococcales bacterium]|nr:class I SAM-dependent methyltransferase [Methylococcales bacterium]